MKVTIVGDGAVGKHYISLVYSEGVCPDECAPMGVQMYQVNREVNGQAVSLDLYHMPGQEDYVWVMDQMFPGTECFVMCFAIDNKGSFVNLSEIWLPRIEKYCPNAKRIVVGMKKDLRMKNDGACLITFEEGKAKSEELKALHYFECSAFLKEGADEIFDTAVAVSLEEAKRQEKKRQEKKRNKCAVS